MSENTKRISKIVVVVILLGLCTVSCTVATEDNTFIDKLGIPLRHFLDIKLLGTKEVHVGQSMILEVANKTNDCVGFATDYGLRIFVDQTGKWTEIPYIGKYMESPNITYYGTVYPGPPGNDLGPSGSLYQDTSIIVQPDYSRMTVISSLTRMRVVLVGAPCKNGVVSGQPVADYIEITIEP